MKHESSTPTSAVFIGLDGVLINTASRRPTPLHSDDWVFNANALDCLKEQVQNGKKVCIVTTQIGIGRGLYSEKSFLFKMENICRRLEEVLKLKRNSVAFNYTIRSSGYRALPSRGMLYELALEYELQLEQSIFVGNTKDEVDTVLNLMPFRMIY